MLNYLFSHKNILKKPKSSKYWEQNKNPSVAKVYGGHSTQIFLSIYFTNIYLVRSMILRNFSEVEWYTRQDLNLRPLGSKPSTLSS